jgi:hypothetical protein
LDAGDLRLFLAAVLEIERVGMVTHEPRGGKTV